MRKAATCVFQMISGLGGPKNRLAKAGHVFRGEMNNCLPLWREAHFKSTRAKYTMFQTTFSSCDGEKFHATVPRSTSASQTAQNTQVRTTEGNSMSNMARLCRKKYMCKSKRTKHTRGGLLLKA